MVEIIETKEQPCIINYLDGTSETGIIHLPVGQRSIDVLNDPRPFLAFQTQSDRRFSTVSKQSIRRLHPVEQND